MGKIKRVRQKFHQSISKDKSDVTEDSSFNESLENQSIGKSPLLKTPEEFAAIPDNLFEGIDINFDSLKKKLEDDRVSVKSIAKSCKYDSKGKLLTKKEKQKLKHDLFMRKINTVEQLKKEALQKHRKRKGLRKSDTQLDTSIEQPVITSEVKSVSTAANSKSDTLTNVERKVKHTKGIKKAKVRQREMLQEVSAFRKILTDPKFSEDPCAAVSESVRNKIIKEVKDHKPKKKTEKRK